MATQGPYHPPKTFVLCFDGTGNKFSGTDADSNILKIYRMLDRNQGHQFHYYQPGIGTYVTTNSLSHTSLPARLNSWYQKAKDSAVGTSFDEHVMGGYKFLMRYYSPGDDIYFFGFSRGAYIARFLAEMLDYVGLLSAGNEELARFAWKTFARWQQRRGGDEEDERKKKELFHFMRAFRETFSRPVRRIRFLGLFDTVNSVPRFESAWMQRSKFPYTARSSAKVIRHAVGIDERRAKFRQDLISENKLSPSPHHHMHYWKHRQKPTREDRPSVVPSIILNSQNEPQDCSVARDRDSNTDHDILDAFDESDMTRFPRSSVQDLHRNLDRYRSTSPSGWERNLSLAVPVATMSNADLTSVKSGNSGTSTPANVRTVSTDSEDETRQDIEEVWFPGCHADIGGGWQTSPGESWPLSHAPLVWMVQEAQKSGLKFDEMKMKELECCPNVGDPLPHLPRDNHNINSVDFASSATQDKADRADRALSAEEENYFSSHPSTFLYALHEAGTRGRIHDCLLFNNGLPSLSVLSWKLMEYLPFRRMDLRPDGSWKPIRWPLPCGEVRDIPATACIHNTVIRRMEADNKYRPGNLILGGGGRGIRVAPEDFGMGQWVVLRYEGDWVRQTYIRKSAFKGEEKKE